MGRPDHAVPAGDRGSRRPGLWRRAGPGPDRRPDPGIAARALLPVVSAAGGHSRLRHDVHPAAHGWPATGQGAGLFHPRVPGAGSQGNGHRVRDPAAGADPRARAADRAVHGRTADGGAGDHQARLECIAQQ
ncbi:hypothetical protein G6F32_016178 [Rhizopus arrhizus]|nr:hypothetical protein G6F32_016178 [Rhizopus arrhizus]